MLLADGPGREQAQQLAREELARRQYRDAQPSAVLRALGSVWHWVHHLLFDATDKASSKPLVIIGLLVVLLLLVVAVLVRIGPVAASRQRAALFDDDTLTFAADHRRAADAYAAAGQYDEAVRERLRAVVRELEVRGVLDRRPGRTAGEVARDAGRAVPLLAAPLQQAARVFDEIWYGGRTAQQTDDELLVAVDRQVVGARLVGT